MGGGEEAQSESTEVIHRLGERIKELTALHRASTLLLHNGGPDDARVRALVELLPPAMQFPDITTACLQFDGTTIATAGYAPTPWTLSVPFTTSYGVQGQLDVVYAEDRPFLVEERSLLASIAEMLRAAFDRDHFTRVVAEQNTWFQLALDTAGMGVWEWDVTTNMTRWSPQIATWTGIPGTSGERGTFYELFHPDDRAPTNARLDAAADGVDDLQGMEFRLKTVAGWRRMACSARIVREPPARATRIIMAIIDVTARRALEDSLRQAQKVEALGQVAAGVAHDFNNILMVILSNLQMLREDVPTQDESREMVDDTYVAAERGKALTRQLLTFSRKTTFEPEALDVSALIGKLQPMLARLVPKTIKVKVEIDHPMAKIWADAAQLEQLVMNLVVNARDAMPNGGVVNVRTETTDASADIVVSDTGTGMPEDVRARIFEPFFTTKEEGKGTGLGLAVVADVAKRWQGQITCDSQVGAGTTFRVRFPRVTG